MKRVDNKPRDQLPRSSVPEPAPGDMRIIQDFVNTELKSTKDLGRWLSRHRLLPVATELTEADLRRAVDVKRGLRALFQANSGGQLDEKAVDLLDQAAVGAHLQARFDPDGSARFESLARTIEGALGYLLGIVVVARLAEDWPRYKLCAESSCRAAFYDFSKSGKGRWCKVRCGDKARARNYRRGEKYKSRGKPRRIRLTS